MLICPKFPQKELTGCAQPQKCVPHERVELKRFYIAIHCPVQIFMSLIKLPLEAINSGCIRQMLPLCFAVLIYTLLSDLIQYNAGISRTHSSCFWRSTRLCCAPVPSLHRGICQDRDMPAHRCKSTLNVGLLSLWTGYTQMPLLLPHCVGDTALAGIGPRRTVVRRRRDDRQEKARF